MRWFMAWSSSSSSSLQAATCSATPTLPSGGGPASTWFQAPSSFQRRGSRTSACSPMSRLSGSSVGGADGVVGLGRHGRQGLPHGGQPPLKHEWVVHRPQPLLCLLRRPWRLPTVYSSMKCKKDFLNVHFLKCIYVLLIVSLLKFVINFELWLMKIEKSNGVIRDCLVGEMKNFGCHIGSLTDLGRGFGHEWKN